MDMSRSLLTFRKQANLSVCSNSAQDNDKELPFVAPGITIFLLQQWFQLMYHSRGLLPPTRNLLL